MAAAVSSVPGGSQPARWRPASGGVTVSRPPSSLRIASVRVAARWAYSVRMRRTCRAKWPSAMKSARVACSSTGACTAANRCPVRNASTSWSGTMT